MILLTKDCSRGKTAAYVKEKVSSVCGLSLRYAKSDKLPQVMSFESFGSSTGGKVHKFERQKKTERKERGCGVRQLLLEG